MIRFAFVKYVISPNSINEAPCTIRLRPSKLCGENFPTIYLPTIGEKKTVPSEKVVNVKPIHYSDMFFLVSSTGSIGAQTAKAL